METVSRLRQERAALVERLTQIDKILRQFDELDRNARLLLTTTPETRNVGITTNAADIRKHAVLQHPPNKMPKKTPMAEFQAAVIDAIRESGGAMDRVELYEALTSRGIVIGDGDREKEVNALSARVYRMAQDGILVSERGQGYRLKSGPENDVEDNVA